MGKRRKIGLIYEYNENWIGGTYYIQNLISALGLLPDEKKPIIYVITESDLHFSELAKLTGYPYLQKGEFFRQQNRFSGFVNRVSRKLIQRNVFSIFHQDLDLVFPAFNMKCFKRNQSFLYWIPDFQEHHLPEFFSAEELEARSIYQTGIVKQGKFIVFSSQAAKNDFNQFYPQNKLVQFVLPFAVTHTVINANEGDIAEKYQLPLEYFVCSNQFWKHKNHPVILRAVALLKQRGVTVHVVFTGKEHDHRNPHYSEELKQLARELDIANQLSFTGFIPRADQLALMKKSIAVIQSSLFEGWSTVVEDGKALGVPVIASGIPVHQEQLDGYDAKCFFSPVNEKELANCMQTIDTLKRSAEYNYKNSILQYGYEFMNIVNSIRHKTTNI